MRQWFATGGDISYGRTATGSTALLQRHEHMLDTEIGTLLSDPEWGAKLADLLGQTLPDLRSLEALFRAAHLRDNETAEAVVSLEYSGGSLHYTAKLTAKDGVVATLERTIVE